MTANGGGVLVGAVPAVAQRRDSRARAASKRSCSCATRGARSRRPRRCPRRPPEPVKDGSRNRPCSSRARRCSVRHRAPLIAPLEEAGGRAGALVVPVNEEGSGVEDGVLHWDGSHWTREPIEIPSRPAKKTSACWRSARAHRRTLGCWASCLQLHTTPRARWRCFAAELGWRGRPDLAAGRSGARRRGRSPANRSRCPSPKTHGPFTVPGTGEPPTVLSQILTVTSEGVWIDGLNARTSRPPRRCSSSPKALDGGSVIASWCQLPVGSAPGRTPCTHELPEPLPTGPSRSIAWANPSTPEGLGERVITGLPEGVSLRLEGTSFTRVLALGGSNPPNDVGGTFGAAFSNPREGWLGQAELPVHLTLHPVASRLTPWPTPFRHALIAIAPQPGAPIGSLSSEALAVGDQGEVARYEPGKGWLPESLLGPGGRRATPRLRAVAWPTPNRAYAVGDLGQMWLWRAETGLWEPDPATPFNFRGNLLAHRLRPEQPRTWLRRRPGRRAAGLRQDLDPGSAPAQVAPGRRSPRSRSPARRRSPPTTCSPNPPPTTTSAACSSTTAPAGEVDEGAATAMGQNVPWAVAGLPDGGAAFTAGEAIGLGAGRARLSSARDPDAPWQQTPTPLPGGCRAGLACAVPRRRRAAGDRLGQRAEHLLARKRTSRRHHRASRRT